MTPDAPKPRDVPTTPGERFRSPRVVAALALLATVALVLAGCGSKGEEGGGEFYAGKTIEIIVPFGAGGGSDIVARFLAPYLTKYLPGAPKVQVVNVEANGDHRVGTNQYAKDDPDGLKLLLGSGSTHSAFLYDSPNVEYDLTKLTPLIGFPLGCVIYVSPKTGIKTVQDLRKPATQLYFGGREPVGGDLYRVSAFHVLGLPVEELWGYEGRSQMQVAFDQGELNIAGETTGSYIQNVQPLVDSGAAIPLFTLGQVEDGELVKDPAFPDLPDVGEVYEELYGQDPSTKGLEWEAYKVQVASALTFSKSLWVHSDAPEEAQNALLGAVEQIVVDEDFLEEGAAELGGYPPLVGESLEQSIQTNLVDVNQEAIDWLREDVNKRYGTELQ